MTLRETSWQTTVGGCCCVIGAVTLVAIGIFRNNLSVETITMASTLAAIAVSLFRAKDADK